MIRFYIDGTAGQKVGSKPFLDERTVGCLM